MFKTISILALLSSSALASSGLDPVVGGTAVPKGAWPDAVAVLAETASMKDELKRAVADKLERVERRKT